MPCLGVARHLGVLVCLAMPCRAGGGASGLRSGEIRLKAWVRVKKPS